MTGAVDTGVLAQLTGLAGRWAHRCGMGRSSFSSEDPARSAVTAPQERSRGRIKILERVTPTFLYQEGSFQWRIDSVGKHVPSATQRARVDYAGIGRSHGVVMPPRYHESSASEDKRRELEVGGSGRFNHTVPRTKFASGGQLEHSSGDVDLASTRDGSREDRQSRTGRKSKTLADRREEGGGLYLMLA